MENKFNTIALGYFNSKGTLVAWSSDTFGSPSSYPKVYTDSEKYRDMLKKKFTSVEDREKQGKDLVKTIGYNNEAAGEIIEVYERSNNKYFVEQDIIEAKVMLLDLVSYDTRKTSYPKWVDVKNCVDEGKFKIAENI